MATDTQKILLKVGFDRQIPYRMRCPGGPQSIANAGPKVPQGRKGGTHLGTPPLPQTKPPPKNTHKKTQIPMLWSVRRGGSQSGRSEPLKVPQRSKGGTTLGIPPLAQIVPTPQNTSNIPLTALVSARRGNWKAPGGGLPKSLYRVRGEPP